MKSLAHTVAEPETAIRILIVDDSTADRKLCRALLEKKCMLPLQINEAEDVPSALQACASWRPDCVLLDYHLQGQVGVHWIQQLKEKAGAPYLPVIMLTGLGDESVAAEAILEGAADYIPKSKLTINALERSIRNALQKSDLWRSVDEERAQREHLHEQLLAKSDELQSLYHTVSHELKTPLTAAREFVSLLLDEIGGPLSDLQREYLEITQECCDRLAFLLNNWLDTVRSETGKLELNTSHSSLSRLIETSVKTYGVLARKEDVSLTLEVANDLPEIDMDVQRMEQTIANLISNAIKFTDSGGSVKVSCGREDDGVFIEVADNGRGIPLAKQADIFKPFAQAEAEDASKKQGMGLGLYVCRTIVELHGGRLTLTSEPGEGSRFRIGLPVG